LYNSNYIRKYGDLHTLKVWIYSAALITHFQYCFNRYCFVRYITYVCLLKPFKITSTRTIHCYI